MDKYTSDWVFCWFDLGLPAWIRLMLTLCVLFAPGASDARPWDLSTAVPWDWRRPLAPRYRGCRWGWAARMLWRSRRQLLARCGLLLILVEVSGVRAAVPWAEWLACLPILNGLLNSGACLGWRGPGYGHVRQGVRWVYRVSVWSLCVLTVTRGIRTPWGASLLGIVEVCERDDSRVELEQWRTDEGQVAYRVRLHGEFVLESTAQDVATQRLFMLFLRQLRTPGREGSPWSIVRQEALAQVFEVKQEHISRWQGYLRDRRWGALLSEHESGWLSEDRCRDVATVWAPHIWQTASEVHARLQAQGMRISLRAVEEAGRRSGLQEVRRHVKQQYEQTAGGVQPREGYVVQQLFRLVEQLEARLQGQAPVQEEYVDVSALRQLAGRASDVTPKKPWSQLFQLGPWLMNTGPEVLEEVVRCSYCHSTQVSRKSRTPRLKAYVDAQGQRQTVEVYRYYCKNAMCPHRTFTDLPPELVLHSVWSLDARRTALELYMGLGSSYRRVAGALHVAPATVYHWMARFGCEPLCVAALFGMVRSSGVVGIDEKYVRIPKNDKPQGKMRKWMYVYVAVDMHTLDVLHIDVFPHLGSASVQTFLIALRAKGYHPQVIVTDLCGDYAAPLATVFPQATHHECLFHALQAWHRHFREAFGNDYARTAPEMFALRKALDHVFDAQTRRTVEKRYAQWQEDCQPWLQADPHLQPLVDSVARHFPLLVNAYAHPLIPLTNNATERLIRRFDQHYQNFAGFDSLETARSYLHLFELTYRFTPFGREVQPHLRGRCPLELAGYDLSKVPLARYLRELSTAPMLPGSPEVVPT